MNFRFEGIRADVDDINAITAQTWKNQLVPSLGLVPEAAGASVPSAVMQFVPNMGHVQDVENCVK